MNKSDMRYAALRVARSLLRELGAENPTVQDAFLVLDEFTLTNPDTVAGIWYKKANKSQLALFGTEWRKDQRRWK